MSDSAEIAVDAPASRSRRAGVDASSPIVAPIRRPATAPTAAISVAELRAGMQQHLRHSGALKTLKTQLRGMVLTELMHQQKLGKRAAGHAGKGPVGEDLSLEAFEAYRRRDKGVGGGGGSAPLSKRAGVSAQRDVGINDSGLHDADDVDSDGNEKPANAISQPTPEGETASPSSFSNWSACVADAVIENHLRRTHRPMSLSIFSTEAEVAPLSDTGAPSEEEKCLRHLLMLSPPSEIGDVSHLDDDIDGPAENLQGPKPANGKKSLLQLLVENQLLNRDNIEKHYRTHRHHCGTQTYEADKKQKDGETNPLLSLECRLAAVDAKYSLTFSQLGRNGDKSFFTRAEVERRLQQYKADIHEQLRAEYEAKYKLYEANKLQDVKDVLESRYQLLVRNKSEELAEMQRSLNVKFEQDRQRLQQQRADVERRAMELDRRQRDLEKMVGDRDLELANKDAIVDSLKDKLRVAQLQCAKWEELSGSRLMEADTARSRERRRMEEIKRMQAEHAAEMRLKEEELSRLRFRLRMLLNNPSSATAAAAAAADEEDMASGKAPQADATRDRVNEDLYHMLVRTEELQRNALDQQKQAQRQQEMDLEERLKQKWDSAWQQGQQSAALAAQANESAPQREERTLAKTPKTASPADAAVAVPAASSSREKKGERKASLVKPPTSSTPSPSPASSLPLKAASPPHSAEASSPSKESSSSSPASPSLRKSSLETSPIVAPVADAASVSKSPSAASSLPEPRAKPSSKSTTSKGSVSKSASTSQPASSSERRDDTQQRIKVVVEEEDRERGEIREEEDGNRKGIEWSAKSQRSILEPQERDRKQHNRSRSSSGSSRSGAGGGGFLGRLEQQRRELQAQQAAEADVIYRDSDDDNDDILFGNKGSDDTDSDF